MFAHIQSHISDSRRPLSALLLLLLFALGSPPARAQTTGAYARVVTTMTLSNDVAPYVNANTATVTAVANRVTTLEGQTSSWNTVTAKLDTNATAAAAYIALAGWPTAWPYAAITNAPWLTAIDWTANPSNAVLQGSLNTKADTGTVTAAAERITGIEARSNAWNAAASTTINGQPLAGTNLVIVATGAITNNQQSAWSSAGNVTLNGTANIAPNQTAASGSSVMTRGLGDARWASRNISLPLGVEHGTWVAMTAEPTLQALRYPTNTTSNSQWYFDTETLPSTNYVFRFYVCTDATGTGTQTMRLSHYSHTLSTRSAVIDAKLLDVVLTSNVWVECAVTNSITVGAGNKVHRIQIGGITGSNTLSGAAFFYSTNHRIEWLP